MDNPSRLGTEVSAMIIMDVKTREAINDSTSDEYYHEKCALERIVKDMEAERIISKYSEEII